MCFGCPGCHSDMNTRNMAVTCLQKLGYMQALKIDNDEDNDEDDGAADYKELYAVLNIWKLTKASRAIRNPRRMKK